jgi:hypothetical protein
MTDASQSSPPVPITAWRARKLVLAASGLALSLAVWPASALASRSMGTPETLPAVEVTTASATFEGWLGVEPPEGKHRREPEGRDGPAEEPPRVDPERLRVSWYFEYAPGASCTGEGVATTPENGEIMAGEQQVRTTVTGLRAGEQYTVCLVDWQTVLPGVSFTTLPEAGDPAPSAGGAEAFESPPVPVPPASVPPASGAAGPASASNAVRLARALAACEKRPKRQRASCVRQARKRYPVAGRSAGRT